MANAVERLTELPQAVNANLSDIFYAVQGYVSPSVLGTSVQETLQQIVDVIAPATILSNPGDPNTVVAGSVYQLLWDTVNLILWVATTTGNAATTVWTPVIGPLTNGQIRIGSTGLAPVANTLTAGAGIAIVNGAGTITISSGGGGFSWNDVTGAAQIIAVGNGYVANRGGGNVAFTLPAVAAFGDSFAIIGRQNGWSVAQGAGQSIVISTLTSTPGVGGSISSTNAHDCVTFVCTVANTEFEVNSVVGNITVV